MNKAKLPAPGAPPPRFRYALPPPPPPTSRRRPSQKLQFKVEKSFKGKRKSTHLYQDNETEMKQLVQDVWTWIHEDTQLEISIEKTRV